MTLSMSKSKEANKLNLVYTRLNLNNKECVQLQGSSHLDLEEDIILTSFPPSPGRPHSYSTENSYRQL